MRTKGRNFACLATWGDDADVVDSLLGAGWKVAGFTSTPPDVSDAGLYVLLINPFVTVPIPKPPKVIS